MKSKQYTVTSDHAETIRKLVAVTRAADELAGGAEDNVDTVIIDRELFTALIEALDGVRELPDDGGGKRILIGPSEKAEWSLRGFLRDVA